MWQQVQTNSHSIPIIHHKVSRQITHPYFCTISHDAQRFSYSSNRDGSACRFLMQMRITGRHRFCVFMWAIHAPMNFHHLWNVISNSAPAVYPFFYYVCSKVSLGKKTQNQRNCCNTPPPLKVLWGMTPLSLALEPSACGNQGSWVISFKSLSFISLCFSLLQSPTLYYWFYKTNNTSFKRSLSVLFCCLCKALCNHRFWKAW